MTFCAICADDIPAGEAPILRPLGARDALVRICADCDAAPIIARDDRRDYEPASMLGADRKIAAFARAHAPSVRSQGGGGNETAKPLTPGWVLIRIAVRAADGHRRDNAEAYESLRGEPWFGSVRSLGTVDVRGQPRVSAARRLAVW